MLHLSHVQDIFSLISTKSHDLPEQELVKISEYRTLGACGAVSWGTIEQRGEEASCQHVDHA